MNKILIVGHPQSGYQDIEALLNDCGMNPALPSRREGFTAEEIGATLCKAHKAQPLHLLGTDQSIDQLETSPVWHSMALDLMLGNVDQELWGWADPSSIYLLDYWKALDQGIAFILVYNSPETLLNDSTNTEHLSEDELQRLGHAWQAYNAALLHFYYRNRERCLLVHAEQVRLSAHNYLQQVRSRIRAPLTDVPQLTVSASESQSASEASPASMQNTIQTNPQTTTKLSRQSRRSKKAKRLAAKKLNAAVTVVQTSSMAIGQGVEEAIPEVSLMNTSALPVDDIALERYLAQVLISQQPQVQQIYAELQSTANLPLVEETRPPIHALQAWRGLSTLHSRTRHLAEQADRQQEELQHARQELADHQQAIHRLDQDIQAKGEQIAQHLATQEKLTAECQGQQQENELILLQLHQVQEGLERFYLESQQQQEKLKVLQSAEKLAAERAKELEKLKQEREKLSIESQQQKEKLKALQEMEKLATERAKKLEQLQQEKQKLTAEQESLKKLAEERNTQAETLKKKLAEESKRAQTQAEEIRKLAAVPVTANEDIKQENDLLLAQLHQVQEELERYYLENQRLRQDGAKGTKKQAEAIHYGAAEQVKSQLAYRLGAIMMKNCRTLPGLIIMPWALLREKGQHRRSRLKNGEALPLSQYRDAQEGEKVKQHLTYRLGSTLITHSKSPISWIKLPFALRREVKTFKQQRRNTQIDRLDEQRHSRLA